MKESRNDLIRINQYGIKRFGEQHADKDYETFFNYFDVMAKRPFSFESVDHIKEVYRLRLRG